MKRIKSFEVDHNTLQIGMYISRVDDDIVTYDLRMVKPNGGVYLDSAGMHTVEHLMATFLRNSEFEKNIIYFGPMGCRTGFYLLLAGDYESEDIISLLREMFEFVCHFEGEIPGAAPEACGNYLDQNLPMAKYLAEKYLEHVLTGITPDRLKY